MVKRAPPDLILCLDFGGSLTKGIAIDKNLVEHPICMEPEVISLPTQAIKDYEAQKIGSPVPLDSAWVSVDSDSYAVGYLARSRFNANAGLSSLKYERAFPKTLAAVWVAAQNLKLKNKFSAAIAILLPVSEYKSSDWLHELLVESLKKFNTPTGQMSVNLMAFDCKPEGCGIYMMRQLGDDAFAVNRKTIAVVMVGYRNASVLVSERGQITIKRTSDLGFVRLVELVEGRVALPPSTARLTTAIAKAGEKFNRYSFLPLASSTGEEARDMEVDRLIEAAKSSRSEYSLALSSWLREVIPRSVELDEVLLCGGTANYMKPELENHFAYTAINWNAGMTLPPHLQDEEIGGTRLCDVWGISHYFRSMIAKSIVGVA